MTDEMPRGRNPRVTNTELLDVVQSIDGPVGAGEVAARVDFGREAARKRLNSLAEDGVLRRKQIGAMNVYWQNGH